VSVSRGAWLARAAALGLGAAAGPSIAAAAAIVGVARGASMAAATRAAVRLAGGLDFVRPGQTVLVRFGKGPNGLMAAELKPDRDSSPSH